MQVIILAAWIGTFHQTSVKRELLSTWLFWKTALATFTRIMAKALNQIYAGEVCFLLLVSLYLELF